MALAYKEPICLKWLIEELNVKQDIIGVNSDSQSAIHLAENLMFHSRTKYIDIRYHFMRDMADEGPISMLKIPTNVNPVDILMKSIT